MHATYSRERKNIHAPALAAVGFSSSTTISSTGTPDLGQRFGITLSSAKAIAPTLWGVGMRPIRHDLTIMGAPGCFLAVQPMIVIGAMTNQIGELELSHTIPNNALLQGLNLFTQFAVRDRVNAAGLVFSNGGHVRIGTYQR